MVRLFLRTLIVTILSSALITQSFAQTVPGPITTNADGTRQSSTTQTVGGYKTSPSIVSSVTMAAVGLVASRLYTYKMTTDVMIAAAGGAAFIFGELKSSKDINDETFQITRRSDGKVDNAQMEAVQKMKSTLEATKKGIETKKTMQTVAAVAFTAAAAAALLLTSSVELAKEACLDANKTMDSSCLATCGTTPASLAGGNGAVKAANVSKVATDAKITAPTATQKTTDTASKTALTAQDTSTVSAIAAVAATCSANAAAADTASGGAATIKANADIAKCNAAYATQNAACQAWVSVDETSQAYGGFLNTVDVQKKINPNFFESLISLVIPTAHADMMTLLFGVGGVAAGVMLKGELGVYVDTWLFTPLKRAAVWGVLAGLSFVARQGSQDNIDELTRQIAKLDAIIAAMRNNGVSGTAGDSTASSSAAPTSLAGTGANTFPLSSDGTNLPCVANAGNTNCASLAAAIQNSPGITSLPTSLQNIGAQIGGFMDKVTGKQGVSADALMAAGSLAGNIVPVNKMLGDAKGNLNALLVKNGGAPVDFAKTEAGLLKQLNNITAGALQKSGTGAAGMLASLGGSTAAKSAATTTPAAAAAKTSLAKSTGVTGGTGGGAAKATGFTLKNDGKDSGVEMANALSKNYELNKGDISTDPGLSIFQVISERYLKSGYSRLLDELPEPAKK
jgi:hypothetical protein